MDQQEQGDGQGAVLQEEDSHTMNTTAASVGLVLLIAVAGALAMLLRLG